MAYSKCNQKSFPFNLPTLGNTWSVAELVQVGPKTCVADVAGIAVSSRCWTSGGHHDLFDCADGVENADCGGSGGCGVTWCHYFHFFPLQCNRYHLPSHSACTKSTGRWSQSFLRFASLVQHHQGMTVIIALKTDTSRITAGPRTSKTGALMLLQLDALAVLRTLGSFFQLLKQVHQ